MKKLVVLLAIFTAALVLTGCPSPAGGNPNNNTPAQVDYLARLIGTWKTHDYDADQYVSVVDTGITPSVTYDIKAKWTFTRT